MTGFNEASRLAERLNKLDIRISDLVRQRKKLEIDNIELRKRAEEAEKELEELKAHEPELTTNELRELRRIIRLFN